MKSFSIFYKFFVWVLFLSFFTTEVFAACSGTNVETWNTSNSLSYSKSSQTVTSSTAHYYPIVLHEDGKLELGIKDNSSNRNFTATLYSNHDCTGTALWTVTSSSTNTVNYSNDLLAGNYTLRIVGTSSSATSYNLSGSLTLITYQESADDICYDKVQQTGFCSSFMNFNCTTTYPIKNISNTNISNVQVIHNEDGMTGSFSSGCTVSPSGTCQNVTNLDMGPFDMFGKATTFNFASAITPTQTTASISTTSMMSMSFFNTTSLYATYQKDGVYYRGKLNACPTISSGGRDFEIRNPPETRNIKGNLKVIGNTVLCVKNNGSCYNYTGSSSNADLDLKYIDIDLSNDTYNSSQAELDIPANATIKWAGFYTQGYLNNNLSTSTTRAKEVSYLTIPTIGRIALTPEIIDLYSNGTDGYSYGTFSTVDSLIGKNASTVNGWLTGANIKADTGTEGSGLGNFGAWTLVVVYEDSSESLKNISIFDGYKRVANQTGLKQVDIPISGFLTPTSGDVSSTLSVFTGEGDKNIAGDKLYVDGVAINDTNAFDSSISGVTRNPSYINNQGIDIQNHGIGIDGDISHKQIIGTSKQSATVTFTSTQDAYFPSMIAFTTELYEPRVCYYIDSIKDQNGNAIFEDTGDGAGPRFTGEITNGEEYTYNIWISNMAQSLTDLNLETALLVQVYMETDNFDYTSNSIRMKNIGVMSDSPMSDNFADDLAEYNSTKETATFRVGLGANGLQGGTLVPTVFTNNAQKAYVQFKGRLDIQGDAQQIDLLDYLDFKASFKTGIVTISPENAQTISQCRDIDSSATVGGVLGAFNVVNEFGGTSDFNNPASSQTWLTTQIANKNFNVKIISLNAAHDALQGYSGDVNLSLIQTPDYGQCSDDTCKANLCDTATPLTTPLTINFPNTSSVILNNFAYPSASRNVSFKISYNNGTQHACSLDKFAIRPEKFTLSTPAFLRAGKDYNISLVAQQYNSTQATLDYNVSDVKAAFEDLNTLKTIYNPDGSDGTAQLNGSLEFVSTPFGIYNGVSSTVGLSFDDVGVVNIKLVDANWSDVDIANGDTPANCTQLGAYVCGEVNATFIPDHFTLSSVSLRNAGNQTFTYLSNDLNHSAKIITTLTAEKFGGGTTLNFKDGAWENNVSVTFTAPQVYGLDANSSEIILVDLNFTSGTTTILSNDTNSSKMLMFNYPREVNTTRNPVDVNGSDFTVNALSTYTNGGTTENVTGTATADQNATFIYGRTNVPNQTFAASVGTTLIYYEAYCSGTDASGTVCNKALLPNGFNSKPINDPRWFANTLHTSVSGTAGSVNKKGSAVGAGEVIATATTGNHQDSTILTYDETKDFPYKTTMENNASSWLIYNQYNPGTVKNEFEVEFTSNTTDWSGLHESNTTSTGTSSPWTNRRVDW